MATNAFDRTMGFGEENNQRRMFRNPTVVASHLIFRIIAIVAYVFAAVYTNSFIVQFLIVLIFLSIDFWTVKNVTGRLLVAMRWWNVVDADGNNHWKFESRKDQSSVHAIERSVFWLALILVPAFWTLLVMIAFVTFKWEWMVVALMGLCMTGANLYGYLRCKWNSSQELTNYLSKTLLLSMIMKASGSGNAEQQQQPMSA